MPSLIKRLVNVLDAIDETGNAALGGSPRETISGTVGRAAAAGSWWARWFVAPAIGLLMRDLRHCAEVAAAEAKRRAADPAGGKAP